MTRQQQIECLKILLDCKSKLADNLVILEAEETARIYQLIERNFKSIEKIIKTA